MGRHVIDILGLNAGYFLGYDGRKQKYVRHPLRSLVGNTAAERGNLDTFLDTIERRDPDVIGLVEVDQGSIRTRTDGQVAHLQSRLRERGLEYDADAAFKYRDISILERVPLIASMSNGVLFRGGEVRHHHLHRGWKRLLTEIVTDRVSIFLCHLPYPLFGQTRQRQLEEMAEILADRERYVVFGDFNIQEPGELDVVRERAGASVHTPGPTYPVRSPHHRYDVFLTGPGTTLQECGTLDIEISDHLAVHGRVSVDQER
ncbi:MAG: endonuclease/exonuclease/phosphatase family protein [Candidatus Nanohaloarchaea archaeon]|nr:endonuclease/exonuclease/phosphatase family protein [Candidatus Nanohaloarchaea archaeon]